MIGRASRRLARRSDAPTASDVRRLLRDGGPEVVAQPILELASGTVTGYEALARFRRSPPAEPQDWFAAAHRSGLGPVLEASAIATALEYGAGRPAGTVLSVNVSPSVLDTAAFAAVLPRDLSGLQFEITEHELADDATALIAALRRLRQRGARIAVDDVGEGYAGLKRVMGVRPDLLKIDRTLVAGVATDPAKVAILEAVVHYAGRTGARVCAEGIETVADLAAVADLDVALAQGWAVGRPADAFAAASSEARAACAAAHAGGFSGAGAPGTLVELLDSLADAGDLAEANRRLRGARPLLGAARVRLAPAAEPDLAESPTARRVLSARQPGEVLASTAHAGPDQRMLDVAGYPSLLLIPLVSAGRTVGLLECFRADERPWSRAELRTARTVAAAAGPVLASLTVRVSPRATRAR